MSDLYAFGVDTGPIPGMVELRFAGGELVGFDVLQCSPGLISYVFTGRLDGALIEDVCNKAVVQLERFVTRGRLTAAQSQTQAMVTGLKNDAALSGVAVMLRSASQVKPWATDVRLERAGLLTATKGMAHARDAARHALFVACHDGGAPDPLSKDWKR